MSGEENWEIMPHRTIEHIKNEIENLKIKAASKEYLNSENFKSSLDNLTHSIDGLMHLFKEATDEMKIEEEAQDIMKDKLDPLIHKLEAIETENRTIAQSILALADMIKERKEEKPEKEIITRTYREIIKPKGMKSFESLPPPKGMSLKPIPKSAPIPTGKGPSPTPGMMPPKPITPIVSKPDIQSKPEMPPHPGMAKPMAPMPPMGNMPPHPGMPPKPMAPMPPMGNIPSGNEFSPAGTGFPPVPGIQPMPSHEMTGFKPEQPGALPPIPHGPTPPPGLGVPPINPPKKKGFLGKIFKK